MESSTCESINSDKIKSRLLLFHLTWNGLVATIQMCTFNTKVQNWCGSAKGLKSVHTDDETNQNLYLQLAHDLHFTYCTLLYYTYSLKGH